MVLLREKYKAFWKKLMNYRDTAYVLMTHENADIDAIASLLIFRRLLESASSSAVYIALGKISRDAERILDMLGLEIMESEIPEEYVVVLLDMSDPNRYISEKMRAICMKARKIFIIDHHTASIPKEAEALVVPLYTSTTEILLELAENIELLPRILQDKKLTKLAMMGIITDTANFKTISPKTFYYMHILTQHTDYREVISMLRKEKTEDISQKIAILKALQRTMIQRISDTLIIVTHVGSYESIVANTIQQLGADITFVVSKKKEKGKTYYRIIVRSKKHDITPIIQKLVEKLGGNYGITQNTIGGAQIPTKIKLDKLKKTIMNITIKHLASKLINQSSQNLNR